MSSSLTPPTMDSSAPLKRIETLPVVDDAGQYAAPFAGYYTVPQYNTMTIPQQYDLPFAKQRKSIAQAFGFAAHELSHPWGDALKTPHADIRETKSAYYIDIDLPGLDDKKSVVIKWTQKRFVTRAEETLTRGSERACSQRTHSLPHFPYRSILTFILVSRAIAVCWRARSATSPATRWN